MNIFDVLLIHPIVNALLLIYTLALSVGMPYALGFSIILLTVVIRLLLYPLVSSQLRASKQMQDLAPHLTRVKDKHKGDAKRLQQETMRLYKEHGVNPAAGCLPILIQIPLLWALYSVLQKVAMLKPQDVVNEINKIAYSDALKLQAPWDQNFFGVPLEQTPSQLFSLMPLILLIPLFTALFQFVQSKMMITLPKKDVVKKEKGKETKSAQDDFASAFQTQALYFIPVMIGFFSFSSPIGLSLYWNTFTLFGILQQYLLQGWGGLADYHPVFKRK